MKRLLVVLVLFSLVAVLGFAQNGTPSSKATAAINTVVYCKVSNVTNIGDSPMTCKDIFSGEPSVVTNDNFVQIMKTTIKVSNSQSLFVTPSLVTGLYTNTKVQTKPSSTSGGTNTSTAEAMGAVYLRAVLYDSGGNAIIAEPIKSCDDDILGCYTNGQGYKGVIFDSRVQTLTQSLSDCVVNVTVGGVAGTGTCDFTSTIQLILQTTSAHSFGFIFPKVGVGVYTISIEAGLGSNALIIEGSGTAVGGAAFGLGSVTAESVRLVHDFAF